MAMFKPRNGAATRQDVCYFGGVALVAGAVVREPDARDGFDGRDKRDERDGRDGRDVLDVLDDGAGVFDASANAVAIVATGASSVRKARHVPVLSTSTTRV